jgi:membrane protein YdbS with pleckstrin-like domain
MENFTNDILDTKHLPKFEEVTFTKLDSAYWKIVWIELLFVFAIITVAAIFGVLNDEDLANNSIVIYALIPTFFLLILMLFRLGFTKKGFAFREHDVLFRYGVIATKTVIIPYNRIQHVSLHEGLLSRYFGLAKIEIFTAGGSSSGIEIPGILKDEAMRIKQLLMLKIQKEL